MSYYEKLCRIMFNGITDALDTFEKKGYQSAKAVLMKAQQEAEAYHRQASENADMRGGGDRAPLYILPHDRFSGEE